MDNGDLQPLLARRQSTGQTLICRTILAFLFTDASFGSLNLWQTQIYDKGSKTFHSGLLSRNYLSVESLSEAYVMICVRRLFLAGDKSFLTSVVLSVPWIFVLSRNRVTL